MKFFLLLAFGVVFLTVLTRADEDYDEDEEEEEEDDDEDDDEPQAMSSAMQLNGNNVGDINNIKGTIKIQFISSGFAVGSTWVSSLNQFAKVEFINYGTDFFILCKIFEKYFLYLKPVKFIWCELKVSERNPIRLLIYLK